MVNHKYFYKMHKVDYLEFIDTPLHKTGFSFPEIKMQKS